VVLGPLAEAMHVVLEGRNNGAMPAWKALSDVELAAVLTFAKNHWSNKTGQLIQPAQFKDARGGKFPEGGAAAPGAAPPAAAEPVAGAAAAAPQPYQVFFATGDKALNAEAQAGWPRRPSI
jgi:cytochrome c oxidase subunit 2